MTSQDSSARTWRSRLAAMVNNGPPSQKQSVKRDSDRILTLSPDSIKLMSYAGRRSFLRLIIVPCSSYWHAPLIAPEGASSLVFFFFCDLIRDTHHSFPTKKIPSKMCTELRQSLAARFGLDQIDISLTQVAVAFPVSSSPLFRMLVLRASDPIIIRGRPLFPTGVIIHVGLSPSTVSRVFRVNQSSRLASLPLANQTKNWSSGPSGFHDDNLNTSGC